VNHHLKPKHHLGRVVTFFLFKLRLNQSIGKTNQRKTGSQNHPFTNLLKCSVRAQKFLPLLFRYPLPSLKVRQITKSKILKERTKKTSQLFFPRRESLSPPFLLPVLFFLYIFCVHHFFLSAGQAIGRWKPDHWYSSFFTWFKFYFICVAKSNSLLFHSPVQLQRKQKKVG